MCDPGLVVRVFDVRRGFVDLVRAEFFYKGLLLRKASGGLVETCKGFFVFFRDYVWVFEVD